MHENNDACPPPEFAQTVALIPTARRKTTYGNKVVRSGSRLNDSKHFGQIAGRVSPSGNAMLILRAVVIRCAISDADMV